MSDGLLTLNVAWAKKYQEDITTLRAEVERLTNPPDAIDAASHMIKIDDLIERLRKTSEQFGNTCVYVRRGGLAWGSVALWREHDDEVHGVFELQAQHDRDMMERLEQIERIKSDRDTLRAERDAAIARAEKLEAFHTQMGKCSKSIWRSINGEPAKQLIVFIRCSDASDQASSDAYRAALTEGE